VRICPVLRAGAPAYESIPSAAPEMKKTAVSMIIAVTFLALMCSASAASAFGLPERLFYDLTWTGIKAGTATMEITRGSNTLQIVSTAKSAAWISLFYTVDDRIESILLKPKSPMPVGQPQSYRMKIREGRHRRNREIIFHPETHSALYADRLSGEEKNIAIHGNVFDPLSSLYYVRTMRLEVGRPIFVDILDNKKLWHVEVLVLRKEKIRTTLGSFDTIVIKPLMKSEGIFYRKGEIFIWLTDDERRLPVMMRTKVAVGSITATLVGGEF
jgi:hypothetical protein